MSINQTTQVDRNSQGTAKTWQVLDIEVFLGDASSNSDHTEAVQACQVVIKQAREDIKEDKKIGITLKGNVVSFNFKAVPIEALYK